MLLFGKLLSVSNDVLVPYLQHKVGHHFRSNPIVALATHDFFNTVYMGVNMIAGTKENDREKETDEMS